MCQNYVLENQHIEHHLTKPSVFQFHAKNPNQSIAFAHVAVVYLKHLKHLI